MINKQKKFLIVGLGLLGGSYAKRLKEQGYYVMGIARRQETIDYALAHHIIDEGTILVDEQISKADYIVLGLYPNAMMTWLTNFQQYIKPHAIITDVSGVKTNIVQPIQELLREDLEFISSHPMAGTEHSGVEHANTEMFKHANYIITPTEKNTEQAIEFSEDLANVLGFNHIATLSCTEHDQMIGFLSQLTHVIAVSLMNTHDNSHLTKYTGDSFRDLTRIAKINENMWTELFLLNKDILLTEIDAFASSLQNFKEVLMNEDEEEMKRLFKQSTSRRIKFDKK